MAEVVARATEPALAAIKLAWWRERLEELDEGKVPAEPRLQAAADELLVHGITGARLSKLEDGWATLLDEQPDVQRVVDRGATLFAIAASLLGVGDPLIAAAGRLYAYGSAKRRSPIVVHRPMEEMHMLANHRFARRARPLTMMAMLAARDWKRGRAIEPQGTPGRALALLTHRLTGRIA